MLCFPHVGVWDLLSLTWNWSLGITQGSVPPPPPEFLVSWFTFGNRCFLSPAVLWSPRLREHLNSFTWSKVSLMTEYSDLCYFFKGSCRALLHNEGISALPHWPSRFRSSSLPGKNLPSKFASKRKFLSIPHRTTLLPLLLFLIASCWAARRWWNSRHTGFSVLGPGLWGQ